MFTVTYKGMLVTCETLQEVNALFTQEETPMTIFSESVKIAEKATPTKTTKKTTKSNAHGVAVVQGYEVIDRDGKPSPVGYTWFTNDLSGSDNKAKREKMIAYIKQHVQPLDKSKSLVVRYTKRGKWMVNAPVAEVTLETALTQ